MGGSGVAEVGKLGREEVDTREEHLVRYPMCVCVYTCMHVCGCTCMHVCMYAV